MKKLVSILSLFFGVSTLCFGKVKVASLHPLVTDLVQQVGGDQVEVINLLDSSVSVHKFEPSVKSLNRAQGAKLYFASGKNLEPYLPKLKSMIGGVPIIEVGKDITSIKVDDKSDLFACCPHGHGGGTIDPHWWHGVSNWKRAASTVADALIKIDPTNKSLYKANEKKVLRDLDILNSWVKKQLLQIPKSRRYLATAHAAYAYFCKEYGFKSVPVQGVNREQVSNAEYLSTVVKILKEKQVKAIFPEHGNNDKSLNTVAKSAGVTLGSPLYADSAKSIKNLFENNVTAIVNGLK